jgi:hypothetical protein
MKIKLTLIAISIILLGCDTYNSKMNNLLTIKKQIEDSIELNIKQSYEYKKIIDRPISDRTESIYVGKTFEEKFKIAKVEDEKIWEKIYPTNLRIQELRERYPKILYSIDSLLKLM